MMSDEQTIKDSANLVVVSCIHTQVRQLNRVVTSIYDDALRPHQLTGAQFFALSHFINYPGDTAVQFARLHDIGASTMSRNLERLIEQGWVRRDPPAGRRGRGIWVEPLGCAKFEEARPAWDEAQGEVRTILSAHLLAELRTHTEHA